MVSLFTFKCGNNNSVCAAAMVSLDAVGDVFAIKEGKLPQNYVVRASVDDELEEGIKTADVVVVFGASKQGKSSLVAKCLPDHKAFICDSGTSGTALVDHFEKTTKIAIADNYHFVAADERTVVAKSLQRLMQKRCIILIGSWLDAKRAAADIKMNHSPLAGRNFKFVNADSWTDNHLELAMTNGSEKLGIKFAPKFRETTLRYSRQSISMCQRVCHDMLVSAIKTSTIGEQALGTPADATRLLESIVAADGLTHVKNMLSLASQADGGGRTGVQFDRLSSWIIARLIFYNYRNAHDSLALVQKGHSVSTEDLQRFIAKYGEHGRPSQAKPALAAVADALARIETAQQELALEYFMVDTKSISISDRMFLIWFDRSFADDYPARRAALAELVGQTLM